MSQNRFVNRDISWLSFNERVLQEAEDAINGLNERLKFLAIFSSNLDEFYRVRVSKLRQFRLLRKDSKIRQQEKPKKVVKQIQKIVDQLQNRFGFIYNDILKELEKEGVVLIQQNQFNEEQKKFSTEIFQNEIKQHISIYDIDDTSNFDFIKDKSLFFFIHQDIGSFLVTIPSDICGRFVTFPKTNGSIHITFIDEIIRDNIDKVLSNISSEELFSVKITRDAELYYEEDDGELKDLIKESLKERDYGIPTRILYDSKMPNKAKRALRKALNLKKTDLMPGGRFHNFSDFFGFPKIEALLPNTPDNQLAHHNLESSKSVIETVKTQDQLLCYPYHNYNAFERLLTEAASREDVEHIYITLYRVSGDSLVARKLIKCLENGKKVTVFVEAKARFDEENNIEWGEKLAKMGATVLYSMADIKVHTKIMLIESNKGNIGYVGTGNFNEKSAKIYADFALLTANELITQDLKEVFNYLQDTSNKTKLNSIWMSPFTTRGELYNRIDNEISIVKSGGQGYLLFKMNSLEDKSIIEKLYEASNVGVEVKLLVRGICCLVPGIKGQSENIEIKSIVGKYLEHSRVYVFGNNGANDLFIGSADCMKRNLDKRVEVIVPIEQPDIKKTIEVCLDLQWFDNVKGRIIDQKQTNEYQKTGKSKINSQEDFKAYLASKHCQLEA